MRIVKILRIVNIIMMLIVMIICTVQPLSLLYYNISPNPYPDCP